jgi:hypothetical protein
MEMRVRFYYGADILPYNLPDFLLSIQDWELGLAARTKKMGKRPHGLSLVGPALVYLLFLFLYHLFYSRFCLRIVRKFPV